MAGQRAVWSTEGIVEWLSDGGGAACTLTFAGGHKEPLCWSSYSDLGLEGIEERSTYWRDLLSPHEPTSGEPLVTAHLRRSESGKWDTRERKLHGIQEMTVFWRGEVAPPLSTGLAPTQPAIAAAPLAAPFTPPPGLAFSPPSGDMMAHFNTYGELVPQLMNYIFYSHDQERKAAAARQAAAEAQVREATLAQERLTTALVLGTFRAQAGQAPQSGASLEDIMQWAGSRLPNLQVGLKAMAQDPTAPQGVRTISEMGNYLFDMFTQLFPSMSEEDKKAATLRMIEQETAARQAAGVQ